VNANVRIVAATNRDLSAMVANGTFRKDLFYRLNIFEICLPPLRERMEDVPLIVEHAIQLLAVKRDKRITGLAPETLRILMSHSFPGNVRELENTIEHGFVLSPGPLIQPEHLPTSFNTEVFSSPLSSLQELERNYILTVLRKNQYNRLATARELGIHKTTFFRKVRKLGIKLPEKDGRFKNAQ
jgi:transcriptional regulator with PAS, ATPase and Fis domain